MTKNLKKQLETVNRITLFNNNQWKITYQNENKIRKEERISKLTIKTSPEMLYFDLDVTIYF